MSNFIQLKEISLNGEIITLSNERGDDSNYYSIIVGPNGSGKSRILRKITVAFVLANKLPHAESQQKLPSNNLTNNFLDQKRDFAYGDADFYTKYSAFEKDCMFALNHSKWSGETVFLNEKSNNEIKIICLSNTVFNKFPKNERAPFEHVKAPYFIDCYDNLSLSEDVYILSKGRNDITDVISKRVIDLFFSSEIERMEAISFLSLFRIEGEISISLCFTKNFNPFVGDDIAERKVLEERVSLFAYHTDRVDVKYMEELVDIVYETTCAFAENIKKSIEEMHGRGRYSLESYINRNDELFKINICEMQDGDKALFNNIKKLSDNNIIKLKNMSFMRDAKKINIYDLSSGELNILLLVIKLHSSIENNSLILIDEPEISLHPAWQRNVIPAIERCFSKFTGCHFIIATHSPQVVSSIPEKNSSVTILGEDKKTMPGFLFKGASADHLLFSTLDSPGEHNEYAIRMLTTILAKLNLKKELSVREILFLEKAIESYPLDNKDDEYVIIKRLLKQVIGLYAGRG